jgi:hypothetical protein
MTGLGLEPRAALGYAERGVSVAQPDRAQVS